MPSPENFGVCGVIPNKNGTCVALMVRPDQLGKLSHLLDATTLPKHGNKTEFNNNLGLWKKAIQHAQRSYSSKVEAV